MDNENEFNFSPKSNFKKEHSSGGFGKTVFVPFLSGIVGASLVVGTCFGIPSVKEKLIPTTQSANYTTSTSSTTSNAISIANYSDTAISVAEKVLPSVVGITVNYQVSSFFGSSTAEATGSGIILTEDGYIVTNNHVISSESSSSYYAIEEATSIIVNLYNDTESYEATVIGTDSYTDLAVLKIEKTGLTPATLGNSDDVKVGEFVMAVGNPLGMDYSVTSGIISAVNREVESDGTTYNALQYFKIIRNRN
jgi:serine protease Do